MAGKRYRLRCMFLLLLLLVGCRSPRPNTESPAQTGKEQEEATMKLTDDEIRILCQAFSDEDRIKEGSLLSYEAALVGQLRFGMDYLEGKYPGRLFRMSDCIPQNKLNPYTTLAICVEGEEECYQLRLETLEDGAYAAQDNYYGALLRNDYEIRLEEAARSVTGGCLAAWVNIPGLYGTEYDAALTLEHVLEQGLPLLADGAVYLDGTQATGMEAVRDRLAALLEEQGLHGVFWVYFLKEQPEGWGTAEELRAYVSAGRESVLLGRERISI